METRKGLIRKVSFEEGIGRNSGKAFQKWTFEMSDDKKYSTFDRTIGEGFKAGDYVSMQGEQNGTYWNMKTMEKTEQTADVAKPTPVATTTKQENSDFQVEVLSLLRLILAELKSFDMDRTVFSA